MIFIFNFAVHVIQVYYPAANSWIYESLTDIAIIFGIWFTAWFPNWYKSKYIRNDRLKMPHVKAE